MTVDEEKALLDQIKSDCAEACGCCTRETKNIVEAATAHMLAYDVSDEFRSALEEYRTQLRYSAEDVASQRYAQRILAAMKRKEGIFFLHDKWGERLNEWVADHEDSIPMVTSLDDLYRIAPKSKPTKKWLTSVENVFKEYSKDAVLEFLRHAITLVTETNEIMSTGLCFDNEEKLRAMVLILSTNRHEQDSMLLRQLAMLAYKKIPDIGPVSTGVGNQCLQALCDLKGTQGVVQLSELASQLKYPKNAVTLVKKKLEEAAKARGLSVGDLESMTVPDYGLNG